jgi:hypothetical protein
MRATVMYAAGDVRVENVPDARLVEPADALVAVTRPPSAAAISGLTSRWNPMRPAAVWAMSSSVSSRRSGPR